MIRTLHVFDKSVVTVNCLVVLYNWKTGSCMIRNGSEALCNVSNVDTTSILYLDDCGHATSSIVNRDRIVMRF